MNLISCNNCAVVLNKDKLHFPLDMCGEDGTIDERKAQYDQEHGEWDVFIPCPVCKEPVFGETK